MYVHKNFISLNIHIMTYTIFPASAGFFFALETK